MRHGALGSFINLKRGYDLPHRDRKGGDVPIISSSGPTGTHNVAKVEGPGVVTGRYGTLGQVFYSEEPYWPLNTSLYVQDFKGNLPRFVYYFLQTLGLGERNAAGAVPGVNRNVLHKMHVSVPDYDVQGRIADFLSAYDDLIENNNRRMALLEESIHLLFREWFVYLRFPGHERVEVVDGVPEGWSRVPLEDLVDQVRDGVHPERVDPETPYVGLEHIPRRCIALSNWGKAADVASNKFQFLEGDVLFGKIRPYFHKVVFAPVSGICSSDAIVMRPRSPDLFGLTLAVASSTRFVDHIWQTAKIGAKMPRANWKVMAAYPVLRPSPTVHADFEGSVRTSVTQIGNLLSMNRALREARDLLLPRLMDGRIAV